MNKIILSKKVVIGSVSKAALHGVTAIEEVELSSNEGIQIVITENAQSIVVLFKELNGNSGASVTNCVEYLIKYIRNDINLAKKIRYFECDGSGNYDEVIYNDKTSMISWSSIISGPEIRNEKAFKFVVGRNVYGLIKAAIEN